MSEVAPDLNQWRRTFFPYAARRATDNLARGNRFAYYTTAETAFYILKNREVWLRNAVLMNDFSEITHGLACVKAAYAGPDGTRLLAALDRWYPGLHRELEDKINNHIPQIQYDTYITCFSEHYPEDDARGRLSMWRAYGGRNGAAIVINGAAMEADGDALGAVASPVFYGMPEDFAVEFGRTVDTILTEETFVRGLGRESVRETMFEVLRYAAVCTKHPGFEEEREWRVLASPTIRPSARLRTEHEVVRSVPQQVVKITLRDDPEDGINGLELPQLLDRVIIGPTDSPAAIALTLYQCIAEAGVPDANYKIARSDIPLRHAN